MSVTTSYYEIGVQHSLKTHLKVPGFREKKPKYVLSESVNLNRYPTCPTWTRIIYTVSVSIWRCRGLSQTLLQRIQQPAKYWPRFVQISSETRKATFRQCVDQILEVRIP